MRALVTERDKKYYYPLIEQVRVDSNEFIITLVRDEKVIRTIHITLKQAIVLVDSNIEIIWMIEFTKENYELVEDPYKCFPSELLDNLGGWGENTDFNFHNNPYNLTKKEVMLVSRIILSKANPNLDWNIKDGLFIKWYKEPNS